MDLKLRVKHFFYLNSSWGFIPAMKLLIGYQPLSLSKGIELAT